MKKFTLMGVLLFCLATIQSNAQVNFEGASEYGRIYDLTYDKTTANKVYAVTLNNHLLESQNNGVDWEVIYTFPDSLARILGLQTLGNDTLSFYIINTESAADNTAYIFDLSSNQVIKQYTPPQTTNATKEWVNSYSIYEANTDVILLNQGYRIGSASYSIVYYSSNGGASWSEVYHNIDHDNVFVNNVVISPNDPQKLFIARGQGNIGVNGGLFISEDGGSTWSEKVAGQTFGPIVFNPTDANTIYTGTSWQSASTVENLYKSIDGGASWSIVPISWDSFSINSINYIAYNPNDVNNIIVLEGNEIVITTDGGATWTNYAYSGYPEDLYYYGLKASFNPFQAGEVFINTDFFPAKSIDGGLTISTVANPFSNASSAGISKLGDEHLYYSVQGGIVHKNLTTQTETSNWINAIDAVGINSTLFISDPVVEGRVFFLNGGFSGNDLFLLENHGSTFVGQLANSYQNLIQVVTDPNNTNNVWVSWSDGSSQIIDLTDVFSPNFLTLPASTVHFATYIDPTNSNHVIIGQGGALYESTDYGTSWSNISTGLTIDPTNDIIYDIKQNPFNSNEFVVSTSGGVFQSIDGGLNWNLIYLGTYLRKIEYSTENAGHIVVGIYTSLTTQTQIVYTTDNGANWTELPVEDIENVGCDSMGFTFQSNGIRAYLSTYDLGVISLDIDTSSLSIPDFNDSETTVLLYPNPVKSHFEIVINGGITIESMIIYNQRGQKLLETEAGQRVNIEHFSQGVYFVRILDGSGGIHVKKIIKD